MFVGIGATKLFLAFVAVLAILPQQTNNQVSWRILEFLKSPPNEIGDTLAGIAGTLAFLWIIVTVMMQSKELRAQREELSLTRNEFQRMAKAQEAQQESLEAQAKIFRDEQTQRDQSRATRILDQKLLRLKNMLGQNHLAVWFFEPRDDPNFGVVQELRLFAGNDVEDRDDLDLFIWNNFTPLHSKVEMLEEMAISAKLVEAPKTGYITSVISEIQDILELEPRLSEDQLERVHKIGVLGIKELAEKALKVNAWDNKPQIETIQ